MRLVVGQLGMEGHAEDVALADRHRVAVDLGQHLDALPALVYPRRADEHRAQRAAAEAVHVHVGLEALHLAAERVAAGADVEQAEVVAVEHDQAGAGAERRRARRATRSRSGSASPSRSMPSVIVVDSPPGITSPSSPSSSAGRAHHARLGAQPREHAPRGPRSRPGWRARRTTTGRYQPRC